MTDDQTTPTLTVPQARALADDLVRELAQHPGDDAAVCAVMRHWLDVLGPTALVLVSAAAMRTVFGSCLTLIARDDAPPGALTITPPKETAA